MAIESHRLGRTPPVLIVDDNVDLAQSLAEFVQSQGCDTRIALSGEEALAHADAGELAAVITDFLLPGIDGVQLVRRLARGRGGRAVLPALVISGYSDDATADAARAAGAAFLVKPLDLTALARFARTAAAGGPP